MGREDQSDCADSPDRPLLIGASRGPPTFHRHECSVAWKRVLSIGDVAPPPSLIAELGPVAPGGLMQLIRREDSAKRRGGETN